MIFWFFIFLLLVAGILTAYAAWKGAPYVPTPMLAVESALDLAQIKEGEIIIDLGAGDGRVVASAAKRGAKVIGYELSPFMWIIAKANLIFHGLKGKIILADGFNADFSKADVIFLFLMPKTMKNLSEKLRAEIRPGVRIVTYVFGFPDWEAEKETKPKNCASVRLYIKT
jgi:SAM-dependent methyltransferase